MKSSVVIFGAGKSSFYVIDYLKKILVDLEIQLIVIDANLLNAQEKLGNYENGLAVELSIQQDELRQPYIKNSVAIISLLPPHLHQIIALDCILFKKALFTASYLDESIKKYANEIKDNQLFFLYEMGLDPGIDHMSAKKIIDDIHINGGKIESFKSHCGGLVSPQSDNNPWHYKISWNPRNIVLAGNQGARYKENNNIIQLQYTDVFKSKNTIQIQDEMYAYYPNRNSLPYIDLYNLSSTKNFIRTTLRHPQFCVGWFQIILLGLTNEIAQDFFNCSIQHWFIQQASKNNASPILNNIYKDPILLNMFEFIGLNSPEIIPPFCKNNIDVLQYLLEKKLTLGNDDIDRVVMHHELEYLLENQKYALSSSFILDGENKEKTAMSKTVGLPLAIAVELYLKKQLNLTGLHIPILPAIYTPVLLKLQALQIKFIEETRVIY
ncbi:MAG: saccharopine dehydrogenase [Sediminibacterium sp.]|nr:saccharopine dehydrogenase [Sediminibacterium sp.]